MKTLLLMRHAKSSWDSPHLSDFERPLNDRGEKTAPFVGSLITENKLVPDMILSSPAKRAKQTAFRAKDGGRLAAVVELDDRIYEASQFRLFEVISEIPSEVKTLLLVGHNPGLEGLVKLLTGELHSIPTGALIKLSLNIINWADVHNDCGSIDLFIKPREEMKAGGA